MARSLSISQIRALGDRLRGKNPARPDDLELLQQLRADHDRPLQLAETVLRERLELRATSRLKTVQTIVEKLVREKTRLSVMQDIAGLRTVDDLTLEQQDKLAARIAAAFDKAETDDRRVRPSYGYRAVHVIVELEGCPVEIQVRTRLQDLWAQAMEILGDAWGRQIRYGLPPNEDQLPLVEDDPSPITRADVVDLLMGFSATITQIEEHGGSPDQLADLRERLERFVRAVRTLTS
jgi:hypothetical protein